MDLKELVTKARTCRRFKGSETLSTEKLTELIDFARLSASARNAQILRFVTVTDAENRASMDKLVVLGGALTPEQRAIFPAEGSWESLLPKWLSMYQ